MVTVSTHARRAWPVALALALLALSTTLAGASNTRYALEIEGYATRNIYFRAFHFTNPDVNLGQVAYTEKWGMANGNVKGLLWLRADDQGDSWWGPELWPHWKATDKWSFDLEARYLWAISDDTFDHFTLYPSATYKLDQRNSVGIFSSHVELIGNGKTEPWYAGPFYSYTLKSGDSIELLWIKGFEGTNQRQLYLIYTLAGK